MLVSHPLTMLSSRPFEPLNVAFETLQMGSLDRSTGALPAPIKVW